MLAVINQAAIVFALVAAAGPAAPERPPSTAQGVQLSADRRVYGIVESVTSGTLLLRLRTGREIVVDRRVAKSFVAFTRGRAVIVYGTLGSNGVLQAHAIWRTFPDSAHWPADR